MSALYKEVVRLLKEEDGWKLTQSSIYHPEAGVSISLISFVVDQPRFKPSFFQKWRLRNLVEAKQVELMKKKLAAHKKGSEDAAQEKE